MSTKYAELLIGLQKKLMAFNKENLMQMKQMYSKLPKKLIDAEVKKKIIRYIQLMGKFLGVYWSHGPAEHPLLHQQKISQNVSDN